MPISIDTITRNKNIFNPDQQLSSSDYGIWDLTKSSISYKGVKRQITTGVLVTDYFQMRPDLIALVNSGGQNNMGSLLKFNGISNPFSLYQGQPLLIPSENTIEESFVSKQLQNQRAASSNTNTNPNEAFKKNQEQKKFKISEGRKKFLAEKANRIPELSLPPNVTQPKERVLIREKEFFVFAPDAGSGFNKPV
jgi:hypothetical protein